MAEKIFILGKNIRCINFTTFSDGESKAQILLHGDNNTMPIAGDMFDNTVKLEASEAVLSSSLNSNTAIIDLCLSLNALSYDDDVQSIRLIIPYMGYARQDRQNIKGESISVIAILRMILAQTNKIKSISFCDIHNPSILKELPSDIAYKNIMPLAMKENYRIFSQYKEIDIENAVIVASDMGGVHRASVFNKAMSPKYDIAIINKVRDGAGKAKSISIDGENVNGKVCAIIDDIVDSAGTLCSSAELLKENGATEIYAFVTHGIFSGDAIEKINNSPIKKIFVTDSPYFKTYADSEKIETVYIPCISNLIWFN